MNAISISYAIELTYKIKGYDNYSFGKDKNLYNLKTGKKLKRTINNRLIGYWIGRKFISLTAIKPLLYKPNKIDCPF